MYVFIQNGFATNASILSYFKGNWVTLDKQKRSAGPSAVLRVYASYVKRYPWLFAITLLGGTITQIAFLISPLYLKQFFNTLAQGSPDTTMASVLFVPLGMVALMYTIELIARRMQGWSASTLESRVMGDLFGDTFHYLINHSHNFFSSNFAGSLTHKVSKYARSFEALFDNIAVSFFSTFLFVVGAVVVLFLRNHTIGIVLGVWSVVFIWFQIYVARLRQPTREVRAEADTKITATLSDAISNQNAVALFSGSSFEMRRFTAVVGDWQKKTLWSWLVDDWIWGGIGIFIFSIEIGLLCGAVVLRKQHLLTIGDHV